MDGEPEVESEVEIEVEDNSTEIDDSETDLTNVTTGDTTVIVETPPEAESSNDDVLLNHESRITALEVAVAGLAVAQSEDEITNDLQSDAIDETVEVVQKENNVPDDEMPASKVHGWWGR